MEPTIQAPAVQDFPVQNAGMPLVVSPNLTEGIVVSAHCAETRLCGDPDTCAIIELNHLEPGFFRTPVRRPRYVPRRRYMRKTPTITVPSLSLCGLLYILAEPASSRAALVFFQRLRVAAPCLKENKRRKNHARIQPRRYLWSRLGRQMRTRTLDFEIQRKEDRKTVTVGRTS